MLRVPSPLALRTLSVSLFGFAALALTGCGIGSQAAPDPVSLTVSGTVHGGQQAVIGAQIQLYAVGTSGNGSTATPLLTSPVYSKVNGAFSITGDYVCPSSTTQVYITATGGNPGLTSGAQNPALAMMAALGNCGDLSPDQFITINEVTSVAAAWTLAPFSKGYGSIGAASTNPAGIANAFLNANLIVDTAGGKTRTLASNLKTEPGKIYALADAMASCINSDGGSGCTPLFTAATPSGGSAPTNTFDAILNIVKSPANNVAGVFSAIGAQPPFATTLTKAPSDWTLSLSVTGGGMSQPTALGLDSGGNVWVANYSGVGGAQAVLSAFGPQGAPLTTTGYGAGQLGESYGLAVDPTGNVWVSAEENPHHGSTRGSIVRFLGAASGGTMGTSTVFSDSTIDYPYGIAADSNGNILVANYGNSSVTVVKPSGPTYTVFSGNSEFSFPITLVPDASNGIWVADGETSATHVDSAGNKLALIDCCGESSGIALDSSGNVWVASYLETSGDINDSTDDGSVAEIGADGTVIKEFITAGGIFKPAAIAVDAAQNVWVANYHSPAGQTGQSFSELAGSTSTSPGAALSPSMGFGVDAGMIEPDSIAIDQSGSLWFASEGTNSIVEFFGMAAPTKTPKPPVPVAP